MRRRRSTRTLVVALATLTTTLLALALPVHAVASVHTRKLSDKACDGFADYFTIEFLVAFAAVFAGLGGDAGLGADGKDGSGRGDSASVTSEEIQDIFHLIFSPRLESVTALLAQESPPSIQTLFARQQAIFSGGVDILEGLGLTKKQLRQLATLDLSPNTDVAKVLGDVDLPKAKLEAAAKEFGRDAGALDLNGELSRAQQRAFERTGSQCGVFPAADVDCESLVGADVSASLVGGEPTVKNDQGTCTYTGPPEAPGDEPVMAVDVYPTPRTFERLARQLDGVEQLDADAFVVDGFASFANSKTCGKTLYARTDADSIVVALCPPGDAEVTMEQLTEVRDAAADALAA